MPTTQLNAAGDTTDSANYEVYAAVAQPPSAAVAQSPSTANWNIVETRNGPNQTTFQYLWEGMGGPGVSPGSYIDELIWFEKNGDPTESNDTDPDDQAGESTADQRYFVHQDRNWNVTVLSEYDTGGSNNGRIVERYSYTPYGRFVVLAGDSGSGELGGVHQRTPCTGAPPTRNCLVLGRCCFGAGPPPGAPPVWTWWVQPCPAPCPSDGQRGLRSK